MKYLLLCLLVGTAACTSSNSTPQNAAVEDTASAQIDAVAAKPEESALAKTAFLENYPLTTWLRQSPEAIGCIFEEALAMRDSLYNCDTKERPIAPKDSTEFTELYYKGIEFPEAKVKQVYPLISSIQLSFEHNQLQEIHIEFEKDLTLNQINQLFDLPTERANFPDNLMAISYRENVFVKGKNPDPNCSRWLTLTGFEHMGPND